MAAKRGKSQARRSGGNDNSIPGWAWMVLGILLTVVVVIVAPKYLKSGGDGFLRVQPNPDARPAVVSEDEDAVAPEGDIAPPKAKPRKPEEKKGPEYQFYTLLPGKEVPLSDEELAATERAEARRQATRPTAPVRSNADASDDAAPLASTLPRPVDSGNDPSAPATRTTKPAPDKAPADNANTSAPVASATPGTAATTPVGDDNTRYLLQAGAFQASGQAEEMKARIALLGVGARVEAAQIGGKTVYRVRMGPYGTASDLAEAKRKLSAGGLPAMAIRVK